MLASISKEVLVRCDGGQSSSECSSILLRDLFEVRLQLLQMLEIIPHLELPFDGCRIDLEKKIAYVGRQAHMIPTVISAWDQSPEYTAVSTKRDLSVIAYGIEIIKTEDTSNW